MGKKDDNPFIGLNDEENKALCNKLASEGLERLAANHGFESFATYQKEHPFPFIPDPDNPDGPYIENPAYFDKVKEQKEAEAAAPPAVDSEPIKF